MTTPKRAIRTLEEEMAERCDAPGCVLGQIMFPEDEPLGVLTKPCPACKGTGRKREKEDG